MPGQHDNGQLVALLLQWFAVHARDLPWRRTRDPYAIWVSEVMLQQTQVKTVVPYWERWIHALPDIQSLARATPAKIHKLWEGLGYYHRARNLQKAAQQVVQEHAGKLPPDFDSLIQLPGIGRYTAGAICSIAFDQPKPILDGNIIRVLTRLFGITGNPKESKTNARLWRIAEDLVQQAATSHPTLDAPRSTLHAPRTCSRLNQALMELGALICTPVRPACQRCPVVALCVARRRGLVHRLPKLARRAPVTRRQFAAFVVSRRGRFLVHQRPAGQVNAHLWEFPNVELSTNKASFESAAQALLGDGKISCKRLCIIDHSITRYRMKLHVVTVSGSSGTAVSGKWLFASQLRQLAFCSAHKKVLAMI